MKRQLFCPKEWEVDEGNREESTVSYSLRISVRYFIPCRGKREQSHNFSSPRSGTQE